MSSTMGQSQDYYTAKLSALIHSSTPSNTPSHLSVVQFLQDKIRSVSDVDVGTTLGVGTFGRVRLARLQDVFFALKISKKSEIMRLKQETHIRDEKIAMGLFSGRNPKVMERYSREAWDDRKKKQAAQRKGGPSSDHQGFLGGAAIGVCNACTYREKEDDAVEDTDAEKEPKMERTSNASSSMTTNNDLPKDPPSRCPFICQLFHAWTDPTHLYLLLEYTPCGELFRFLRSSGRISQKHARLFAAELVLALEALHDHFWIYRDPKPENIVLNAHGHIRLVDFGFAKYLGKRGNYGVSNWQQRLIIAKTEKEDAAAGVSSQSTKAATEKSSSSNSISASTTSSTTVASSSRNVFARIFDSTRNLVFNKNSASSKANRGQDPHQSSEPILDLDLQDRKYFHGVRTHTLCGTPEYIPPEIILSKGHGRMADWWSLGILIYEMLNGHPPFAGEDPFEIYQNIIEGEFKGTKNDEGFSEDSEEEGVFGAVVSLLGGAKQTSRAQDLIVGLLTADPGKRLGCGIRDSDEIKDHAFFREIEDGSDGIEDGWRDVMLEKLNMPHKLEDCDSKDMMNAQNLSFQDEDGKKKFMKRITGNFDSYEDSAETASGAVWTAADDEAAGYSTYGDLQTWVQE